MKNQSKRNQGFILLLMILLFSGCKPDPPAELKLQIEKYVEYWNTGEFWGIEEVLCDDFELITSPQFVTKTGIETFKETIHSLRAAYPDFKLAIEDEIYEVDKAAGIWTITATNTGYGNRPPTGKAVKVKGMSFIHFQDGKIKDEWISGNDLGWLQQLGYTLSPPDTEE